MIGQRQTDRQEFTETTDRQSKGVTRHHLLMRSLTPNQEISTKKKAGRFPEKPGTARKYIRKPKKYIGLSTYIHQMKLKAGTCVLNLRNILDSPHSLMIDRFMKLESCYNFVLKSFCSQILCSLLCTSVYRGLFFAGEANISVLDSLRKFHRMKLEVDWVRRLPGFMPPAGVTIMAGAMGDLLLRDIVVLTSSLRARHIELRRDFLCKSEN